MNHFACNSVALQILVDDDLLSVLRICSHWIRTNKPPEKISVSYLSSTKKTPLIELFY